MRYYNSEQNLNIEQLISAEVKRLSEKYGKSYLDCEELIELTGLGRDNVRALMSSANFPITKVGNRKVVSILAFVTWQMRGFEQGGHYAALKEVCYKEGKQRRLYLSKKRWALDCASNDWRERGRKNRPQIFYGKEQGRGCGEDNPVP